jgi:periplasmic divalent cation tolerance protein
MTNIVLVLTTVPAGDPGNAIAAALLEARLAACVNIGPPMTSVYWWRGTLTRDTEQQLVIKTTVDRVSAVKARLMALHSYEVPEIIVIPVVDGSEAYFDWVRSATASPPPEDQTPART